MAWTAPRTWANGLVVTATILNTEIRDNLLELSTHVHDGAAGEGNDVLSGVDSITSDDIADPAAPGASKTTIYSNASKLHQRAGAAGSAEELSVVGHTHNVAADVVGGETAGLAGDTGLTVFTPILDAGMFATWKFDATSVDIASRSVTFGGDALAFASAYLAGRYTQSGGISVTSLSLRLKIDGTVVETFTDSSPADNDEYEAVFLSGQKSVASGASSFVVELINTGTDASDYLNVHVRMYSGSAIYS